MKRFILPCVALIAGAWTTGGQAAGLFDDEKLSEGEVQAIERQSQLIGQTREALGVMRWLFLREEMQKGDCSPAIEIEGKAKSGDAESQWLLADLHRRGLCVKQSAEETARWLEAASEQDYARAQFELGLAYGTGTGVQQNYVLAVQNFRSAAEGGVARAARRLGEMYRDGEGVPQDRQKAVSWFERGIELGDLDSAAKAALMFLADDPEKALVYSLPAASSGHELSQLASAYALADLPTDQTENFVEAHKWANLASTASSQEIADKGQQLRSELEAKMTQSNIAAAQQRASEWKPITKSAEPDEVEQQSVQLPVVDPSSVDQLSSHEAKLRLKELSVPINKDAFFEAVKTNDLGVFKLFHKAGADLETTYGTARITPLWMAANYEAQNVFDYLLAKGANVNAADDASSPLVQAILWENQYMIDRLLEAGASARQDPKSAGDFIIFGTALVYAIMKDDPDLIRRLFKHGASVDERYAWNKTTLMIAAEEYPEAFQILLEFGADPNAVDDNGQSVLHHILEEPPIDTSILHLSLEAGADPNAETGISATPLLIAVYLGDPGAVKLLLAYKAQLDRTYAMDQGEVPIVFPEEVRRIVMNEGTALMVAAQLGHASVAEILLIYGADKDQKIVIDGTQFRAADFACDAGHDLVCNMLK